MRPERRDLRLQLLDRVYVIADQFDQRILGDSIEWQMSFGDVIPPEVREKIQTISDQLNGLYLAIGGLEP